MNILDFLAILPFYLELILNRAGLTGLRVVRIVRLTRVFRIFKLSRYSMGLKVMILSLKKSAQALYLLIFFLLIGVVMFGSVMYYVEKGELDETDGNYYRVDSQGEKVLSPFQTIPHSLWWAIVTMTTVGYGDVYPVTVFGKILAVVTFFLGILVRALYAKFELDYRDAGGNRRE